MWFFYDIGITIHDNITPVIYYDNSERNQEISKQHLSHQLTLFFINKRL
jgi:hypothetical protein